MIAISSEATDEGSEPTADNTTAFQKLLRFLAEWQQREIFSWDLLALSLLCLIVALRGFGGGGQGFHSKTIIISFLLYIYYFFLVCISLSTFSQQSTAYWREGACQPCQGAAAYPCHSPWVAPLARRRHRGPSCPAWLESRRGSR